VKGVPSLVVEIGSPSTRKRDATIKRRLYERVGVDEYWIIDPELDTVDVYRRIEGRYQRTSQLSLEAGDVLTTSLLPGLDLPLSTIFED
jgi:Uma2 family endonuclease